MDDAVEASFPGCWYGKLDLSNCFLSFPLHPSVRKYFCFRFEGELYQFTHLPFGLSSAPRVCTQLLSVVQFALTDKGTSDVRYLDDFFFIADSEAAMARVLPLAQSVFGEFGLVVNPTRQRDQPSSCPSSASSSTRSSRPCPALPSAWRSSQPCCAPSSASESSREGTRHP